jgi:hypothetical protein
LQKSKAQILFRSLTPSEQIQFTKFLTLQGPASDHLVRLHKALQVSETDPEKIWQRVFPKRSFHDGIMRKYLSDLAKVLEDYMIYRSLRNRPDERTSLLLDELLNRELDKEFLRTWKQAAVRSGQVQDPSFYFNRHELAAKKNRFISSTGTRTDETLLQEAADQLDQYYLISKLKYYCEMISVGNVLEIEYEILLMDEILDHLSQRKYDNAPAVAIYYHIVRMLTAQDDAVHYKELKTLLLANGETFSTPELKEMYTYAINYCIKQINLGKTEFLQESFELYKWSLTQGILFEKNHLTPWSYKNIVTVGLRLNEFEWVEWFIHEYIESIARPYRENAYTYNMAKLAFEQNDYDKVLELLQQVEYDDVFYNLDSKAMLLKTYFELDEVDALFSLIDSFRLFLHRNKVISTTHKRNYLNLVRYVKRATRLIPGDKSRVQRLRRDVQRTGQVADINWLLGQLDRLAT